MAVGLATTTRVDVTVLRGAEFLRQILLKTPGLVDLVCLDPSRKERGRGGSQVDRRWGPRNCLKPERKGD